MLVHCTVETLLLKTFPRLELDNVEVLFFRLNHAIFIWSWVEVWLYRQKNLIYCKWASDLCYMMFYLFGYLGLSSIDYYFVCIIFLWVKVTRWFGGWLSFMFVLQYRKSEIEEFLKECTSWSCKRTICFAGSSGLVGKVNISFLNSFLVWIVLGWHEPTLAF